MDKISVRWRVVTEVEYEIEVPLSELPQITRDSIVDGQILVDEGCSDERASDALALMLTDYEEQKNEISFDVTDRVILEVNPHD